MTAAVEWPHETALREASALPFRYEWAASPALIAETASLAGITPELAKSVLSAVMSFRDGLDGAVSWAASGDCSWPVKIALYDYEAAYLKATACADDGVYSFNTVEVAA